ncbi:hypothetical protein QTN25_006116 [Entamoeba marina]
MSNITTYPIQFGDDVPLQSNHAIIFNFESQPNVSSYLTSLVPSLMIVKYMVQLTKQTYHLLQSSFCVKTTTSLNQAIFKHNFSNTQLIIKLNRLLFTKQNLKYDEPFTKNSVELSSKYVDVIDFDPLQIFVNELQTYFGNDAVLFVDLIHGSDVGVLFKPTSSLFKVVQKKIETTEIDFNDIIPKESIETLGELKMVIKYLGDRFIEDVKVQ